MPTTEQMAQILALIAGHVLEHRTTLVFVNTRRMAERVAHQLGELLAVANHGEDQVAAHHGSLSKDRRLRVEARLRSGDLKALGGDGFAGAGDRHRAGGAGVPDRVAAQFRDVPAAGGTVESHPDRDACGAAVPDVAGRAGGGRGAAAGDSAGRLDLLHVPVQPLDILAQQVVAECAAEEWGEADLLGLLRQASPFAALSGEDFEDVLELVSEGIRTGRGRRAAYLHRDRVAGRLRGRRGARLAALTSGGAIPELGDYRVLAEPDGTPVGTVNEDWAVESMAGDVFLLGTTSWRIPRVEPGVVRVVDAQGAPPSVPFWLGEAPGRTDELSAEVPTCGRTWARGWGPGARMPPRGGLSQSACDRAAAETIARYLAAALAALGCCLLSTRSCWSGSSTRAAGCSWSGTRRSGRG